jgi:hypothetical protein
VGAWRSSARHEAPIAKKITTETIVAFRILRFSPLLFC